MPGLATVTAGTIIGVTEIDEQELLVNTTTDVLINMHGEDGVTVLGRQGVVKHTASLRVVVTAGTIIGVIEINVQELLVNTTEDVLINMHGVDDAIALDRHFAAKELAIRIISFEN